MAVSQASAFLHKSGFLFGLMCFILISVPQVTSWEELAVTVLREVAGPGTMVYLVSYRKEFFVDWYDLIFVSVQSGIAYVLVVLPPVMEGDRIHSPVFVLTRFTPLVAMSLSCIFYPTTFWAQLWGQAFGSVISYTWIHKACSNTLISAELSAGISRILWHLHAWFGTVFVISPARSYGTYSCVDLLGLAHYTLGFVIPCALKYILESRTRAIYLAPILPPSASQSINFVLWRNITFCGCVSVATLMSIVLVVHKLQT